MSRPRRSASGVGLSPQSWSRRIEGAPIYVILDNLSAHKGDKIRRWAKKNRVELCFTPTEARFESLRQFTITNSHHRNHSVQTRDAYLRWRNANARHPDVLAAQRRERARIRSEKGIRWGGRPLPSQPERSDESMRSQPERAAEHRTDESLAHTA